MAAGFAWLAAIGAAMATSHLVCNWVGRRSDGLVSSCAVLRCLEYICSVPSVNRAGTFSILPILVVSIIDVKRFQRRYDGQTAPLNRPKRWTNTTIQVHTYLHSITEAVSATTRCSTAAAAFLKFMRLSRSSADEKYAKTSTTS